MVRLVGRKLLLILILLPLLNAAGFYYATLHPRFDPILGVSYNQWLRQPKKTYGEYARQVISGDLGQVEDTPIETIIGVPLRRSLVLLAVALAVVAVLGPTLGVLSVSRRTRRITPLALVVSTAALSMPGFFLGVMILGVMIYATLHSGNRGTPLPLSGYGLDEHLLLPLLVLASRPTFQIARVTAGLLEHELQQDYIRVAQSKGLGSGLLFWRHAFPNIMSAIVVTIGQSARLLIGGLIIVEALFLWPGIGRILMLDIGVRTDGRMPFAFYSHADLLAALAVIFGGLLLIVDLVTSVLSYWLDPRLRGSASGQSVPGGRHNARRSPALGRG